MFRHVVMFKWADGVTGEQQQAIAAELAKLPARIPAIREYQFGPDARVDPGNHDFAVVADFDDAEGYVAYRDHPAHRAVVDTFIRPASAGRAAVQYEF